MAVQDVLALQAPVLRRGVEWCIVGGWGVDALLGEQTRPHKDLDVLVRLDQLRTTLDVLRAQDMQHAYSWEENLLLNGPGDLTGLSTAFVMTDTDGREIDIHVYEEGGSHIRPLWATHRVLTPPDLAAQGVIGGEPVTCMTPQRQLEFHRGYELPDAQQLDVARLRRLIGAGES
jgi:lincosamide nucleotidyltransferase A/C/D/E